MYPVSNLIKLKGSNDIYLIEGSIKEHIASPAAFDRLKLEWDWVMEANEMESGWYGGGG